MKFFSSDIHLNHSAVLRFSDRPFETIEEQTEYFLDEVNTTLSRNDDFYFLGDLSWNREGSEHFFNNLKKGIRFHWLLGNHDKQWQQFVKRCVSVSYLKTIKIGSTHVVLGHFPMVTWDKSHYNAWMLFGHHHNHSNGFSNLSKHICGKTMNVNWEFHNYKLWSEDEVINVMKDLPDNWDLIK